MLLESEIREKLVDVLQDKLSVEEFGDWLSLARRNVHRDSSRNAQRLAADLSSLLYQYADGHLNEAALESEMEKLANVLRIDWAVIPAPVIDLSSDSVILQASPLAGTPA